MSKPLESATAPALATSIKAGYEKRLMIAAGRASHELGGKIAEQPRRRPHRRRPEDVRRRRGLLPLRGVDPRRRPLHRAVDLRLRARGPHRQRRARWSSC